MALGYQNVSPTHSSVSALNVGKVRDAMDAVMRDGGVNKITNTAEMRKLGIGFADSTTVQQIARRYSGSRVTGAMDALQPTVTTGSVITPIQFLQQWLPGFVHVITQALKIDELVGINTVGSWEDYQIVQGIMELTGTASVYDDYTPVPLASFNTNFVNRSVVRFEEGMWIRRLEQAVAARIRVSDDAMKRNAAALQLEIARNRVGFYGFILGQNNTYGFLNDPNLPAYVPVAAGAGGTFWSVKTFLEITADIRSWVSALRTQSGDRIDPMRDNLTLALPTDSIDYLTTVSDFGISVMDWLKQTYPKIRPVSAPELNLASGGSNVAYLFADKINDSSDDGGQTFIQVVPTKFMVTGVQQDAKGYVEDYTNATAGVLLKRPWAVYRASAI
jgi:hypothetical protein